MEGKVAELEMELDLAKAREVDMERKLAESSKEVVIKEYKASQEYEMDWTAKVLPYYDQGKYHVLRMVAASGASAFQLFKWGQVEHYSEAAQIMHNIVHFSTGELDVLRQREPQWSTPSPIVQNIPYLLEVAMDGGIVEMIPNGWRVEPAPSDEESGEEGSETDVDENDPTA